MPIDLVPSQSGPLYSGTHARPRWWSKGLRTAVSCVALLAGGQALAQEAATAPAAQPDAADAAQSAASGRGDKVCQYEDVTGSRMRKRVCYTPQQWEARERASREFVRELDGRSIGRQGEGG